MKKIYVPEKDEMYQIQNVIGADNMYKYLMIKAAEVLITEGVNYPAKGMLNQNFTHKYILEDEELTSIIARIYPEVISKCDVLSTSSSLCRYLIDKEEDRKVENLDNLSYFKEGINYNPSIVFDTILMLSEGLKKYPKYRFTYKESPLLESIFSLNYDNFSSIVDNHSIRYDLLSIDPTYLIKLNKLLENPKSKDKVLYEIEDYFKRYGLTFSNPNNKEDIITNPELEVKRLIKTMNKDKDLKY